MTSYRRPSLPLWSELRMTFRDRSSAVSRCRQACSFIPGSLVAAGLRFGLFLAWLALGWLRKPAGVAER